MSRGRTPTRRRRRMCSNNNCNNSSSSSSSSRHISRIIKSCFPTPNPTSPSIIPSPFPTPKPTSITSLPDDILLDILSRLPLSTLPSLSSVSPHWLYLLLSSPLFPLLRRTHHLILPTLFLFSPSSSSLLRFPLSSSTWYSHPPIPNIHPHSRFIPLSPRIYIISRINSFLFHPWTGSLLTIPNPISPRKHFAAAAVDHHIYISGGSSSSSALEAFDPTLGEWRVVSHAPRKRYGCIGVGLDGIFYIIGGLKVGGGGTDGGASDSRTVSGVYASSMDLYDVASGGWLKSRAVPGGGCVIAACGVLDCVYLLASHAVELSFWRFNGKRGCRFGEWCRLKRPPLPAQLRLDGTIRFTCVGVQDKVVLIQVMGGLNDLLNSSSNRRHNNNNKEGLVLIFDCVSEEWSRGPDLPGLVQRAACVCVEC